MRTSGLCAIAVSLLMTAIDLGLAVAQTASTGFILQANEGERRVRRATDVPFILKVDKKNGGSSDFVIGVEELRPGQRIPLHRHPHGDEIIFVHRGVATVTLGEREAMALEGATIYIPRNVRIGLTNPGRNTLTILLAFSKPGFEEYLRDTSSLEGEPLLAITPDEREKIFKKHEWHTVYEQRRN